MPFQQQQHIQLSNKENILQQKRPLALKTHKTGHVVNNAPIAHTFVKLNLEKCVFYFDLEQVSIVSKLTRYVQIIGSVRQSFMLAMFSIFRQERYPFNYRQSPRHFRKLY